MIVESFSPLVRRILALALLLLATLLAFQLLVAPILNTIGDSRRALSDARFRLARLQSIVDGPAPPSPPAMLQTQLLRAPDRAAAETRLLAVLRNLAAQQGLRFEGAAATPAKEDDGRRYVRLEIAVEGPADALTQWLHTLESGEIVLRFARAELVSDGQPASAAKLTGELRAVWANGR